jgi:hypothetical protein
MNSSNKNGRVRPTRDADRFLIGRGKKMSPKIATAQYHGRCRERLRFRVTVVVLDVVLTLTFSGEADVALRVTVEGIEQSAPMGAPVQVRVAAPLMPLPPMERL